MKNRLHASPSPSLAPRRPPPVRARTARPYRRARPRRPGVARDEHVRYVALATGESTIVAASASATGGSSRTARCAASTASRSSPSTARPGASPATDARSSSRTARCRRRRVTTRFAVLDTKDADGRGDRAPGSWSYDAISPDGSRSISSSISRRAEPALPRPRLRPAHGAAPRRARSSTGSRTRRLMRGQPATRATSPDGRWAYTLYARRSTSRSCTRSTPCAARRTASTCRSPDGCSRCSASDARRGTRSSVGVAANAGAAVDTATLVAHGS